MTRSLLLLALFGAASAMNGTNTTTTTGNATTPTPTAMNATTTTTNVTTPAPATTTPTPPTPASANVLVEVQTTYPDAPCSSPVMEELLKLEREVLEEIGEYIGAASTCGSIHNAHTFRATPAAAAVAETQAAVYRAALNEKIAANEQLAEAVGTASVAVTTTPATCSVENAALTVQIATAEATVCRVVQCETGYDKVVMPTPHDDICRVPPRVVTEGASNDDDLSDGAIAGIVVAVVVFLVVVGGIAIHCSRTGSAPAYNEPLQHQQVQKVYQTANEPIDAEAVAANPEQ